jgi:homoserine O-acetyltransferase
VIKLQGIILAAVLYGGALTGSALGQGNGPFGQEENATVRQTDAVFANYRFRDGETLAEVRINYATLGEPHRDKEGQVDNAVLVLHWTGSDSRVLLAPEFMHALFDPGGPLDSNRYYLIFADSVGHGRSSKPSDGLRGRFPNYGYGDVVDLQHKLIVETLGIKRLHASACQWAA